MIPILLSLGLVLLIAGSIALLVARAARRRSGVPAGAVRYSDTGDEGEMPAALQARSYGLAGRPDYLVQQGRQVIPVEVKSRAAPPAPHYSHVLQLAAYCLLVEENYGRPDYGILRYADRSFHIPYTPELRQEVIETLAQMRDLSTAGEAPTGRQTARCRQCGYREDCGLL